MNPNYNFRDVDDTIAHWVSVKRFKELLAELQDDDVLSPNMVGNLSITRDEDFIGWIDLLNGHQELELLEPDLDPEGP